MYSMMNTGMGYGFLSFWILHWLFMTFWLVGVILFVVWTIRYQTAGQLKQWWIWLFAIGVAGSLLMASASMLGMFSGMSMMQDSRLMDRMMDADEAGGMMR